MSAQEREVAVRSSLERVEQELLHQVQERNAGRLRFPILDLYERYELSSAEQEIFIFSLVPHLDDSVRKSFARYNDNVWLDFPRACVFVASDGCFFVSILLDLFFVSKP